MKALLRVLLILLLIAGLVAGGIYGYSRYTLSQPCEVQPVGNWLLEYSPNQTYLGGSVTSGTSMIVYGDKDKVPLEILVSEEELNEDYILPHAFDPRVGKAVAKAVAQAARDSGVARI